MTPQQIALIEDQLAEERAKNEEYTKAHIRLCVQLDGFKERAEAAEARVKELQALVEASSMFEFGEYAAASDLNGTWTVTRWPYEPLRVRTIRSGITRDEAIAIARERAAKDHP